MVAVEALQDPFFHMYTLASDEENFKSLDVSVFLSCIKITMTNFKFPAKIEMAFSQILAVR